MVRGGWQEVKILLLISIELAVYVLSSVLDNTEQTPDRVICFGPKLTHCLRLSWFLNSLFWPHKRGVVSRGTFPCFTWLNIVRGRERENQEIDNKGLWI